MKSILLLVCVLMFCAASLAQSAQSSGDPEAQALIAKSRSVLETEKSKDVSTLSDLLADNFRSIDLAGDFGSRQEMLATTREGFLQDFLFYEPQAFRIDNDSVLISYNMAITLSEAAIKQLAEDNLVFPRYSKVSDLWVRLGSDWKLKFEQTTPVRIMY
jgi:hypothetical protein